MLQYSEAATISAPLTALEWLLCTVILASLLVTAQVWIDVPGLDLPDLKDVTGFYPTTAPG